MEQCAQDGSPSRSSIRLAQTTFVGIRLVLQQSKTKQTPIVRAVFKREQCAQDGSPSRSSIRLAQVTVYQDDVSATAIKQQVNIHCKGLISQVLHRKQYRRGKVIPKTSSIRYTGRAEE